MGGSASPEKFVPRPEVVKLPFRLIEILSTQADLVFGLMSKSGVFGDRILCGAYDFHAERFYRCSKNSAIVVLEALPININRPSIFLLCKLSDLSLYAVELPGTRCGPIFFPVCLPAFSKAEAFGRSRDIELGKG
jgi:hypothetical protein